MYKRTIVEQLAGPECYYSMIEQGSWLSEIGCLKAIFAKLASYGIIIGSFALKAPQIFKIVMSQNVVGISAMSVYWELAGYITTTCYNMLMDNPISTYGELIAIIVQNCIIVVLVWLYAEAGSKPSVLHMASVVGGLLGLGIACLLIPEEYFFILPLSSVPVTLLSRMPQILTNLSNGHTGQLAPLTLLLSLAGGVVRLLTFIQQVGWDMGLIVNYGTGCITNAILVFQVIVYWRATQLFYQTTSKQKHKSA
eukprot:268295_1